MKCGGKEPDFESTFSIIKTCACTEMKCAGSGVYSGIKITDESGVKVEERRRRRR